MNKKCQSHRHIRDFKVSAHEWRCCGCGKVALWDEDWSYFGQLGCPKCGCEPVIEFVACSEACRAKHVEESEPMRELKNQTVEREAKRVTIATLEQRIAVLQENRNKLKESLR